MLPQHDIFIFVLLQFFISHCRLLHCAAMRLAFSFAPSELKNDNPKSYCRAGDVLEQAVFLGISLSDSAHVGRHIAQLKGYYGAQKLYVRFSLMLCA